MSSAETFGNGKPFSLGTFPSAIKPGSDVAIIGKVRPNKKTGNVVQLAFLDASIAPKRDLEHARKIDSYVSSHGCDSGCTAFRGCYVSAFAFHIGSIDRIWHDWKSGSIPTLSPRDQKIILFGRTVRFGEYGDPASVRVDVIERIAGLCSGHLGYTHRWRSCDPGFARYCMASVESTTDYVHAMARGYRPFLVVPAGTARADIRKDITAGTPTPCVHDIDGTQCDACPTPCNGTTWTSRKAGIYVIAHGRNAKSLTR